MDSKLQGVMADVLELPIERIHAGMSTESESEWDSLRHMNLIFALEDAFGVRFDDDEIATLTSVARIEQALSGKRG